MLTRENARGDEQGITRKKKTDEQAGLYKENAGDNAAKRGGSNPFNELFQAFGSVQRAKKMKDGMQRKLAALASVKTKRRSSPPGSESTSRRSW
ncbi:MAG TPA: hypothetical protein VKP58_10655 [Candidatus Acidoferrum sp.]|nr:hypothetical protein [Candidatus Acidoferrum sp.]